MDTEVSTRRVLYRTITNVHIKVRALSVELKIQRVPRYLLVNVASHRYHVSCNQRPAVPAQVLEILLLFNLLLNAGNFEFL